MKLKTGQTVRVPVDPRHHPDPRYVKGTITAISDEEHGWNFGGDIGEHAERHVTVDPGNGAAPITVAADLVRKA